MSDQERNDRKLFLGHSVKNKQIRYSSVSQIVLFDPEHEGCPRKWGFQYVFGKKLKKTGALTEGIDYAGQLEHYLKTGEDTLEQHLQQAKKYFPVPGPDLEVERPLAVDGPNNDGKIVPGGGLLQAIQLRDQILANPNGANLANFVEMKRLAGLLACGVPLEGAADYRHMRGEYIDENGELLREPAGAVVCETGDLKMVSRIVPHTIRKGPQAGTVLPSYAKTPAQVCEHPQMLGYGVYIADREPSITHVRLSHVYGNKKRKEATKRTGIISVMEVRRRWQENVEQRVMRKMIDVATADRIEDVEPNTLACESYTHVDPNDPTGKNVLKGCGHRYYCPLSSTQISMNLMGPYKETAMSLFDTLSTRPQNGVPLPPQVDDDDEELDDTTYNAQVEAEKAKLLGAPPPPPPPPEMKLYGFCPRCGTQLVTENVSVLKDKRVVHIGCKNPVVPPDAPSAGSLQEAAAPVPQAEIDKIEDPALKEKVQQHANEAGVIAAAEEAKEEAAAGSVWCGDGKARRIKLDMEMALNRKMNCDICGKEIRLKPAKEGNDYFATLPRHKPVQVAPAATAPTTAPLPPAPPPHPLESATPPAPPPPVVVAPPPPPPPPPVQVMHAPQKVSNEYKPSREEIAAGARMLSAIFAELADHLEND